uniref:Chromosome 10 open reading frame 71 n=1 Tax=Amazona collaria TaxID=241587 RepID=A0A8B9FVJ6_9PSIT
MQGNRKHTEGHSDSSSIGSLLDETDREVSSLTDRAFRSLCVAELEDSYSESDLPISPNFALQFSAKIHPGTLNHAIKKSNVCNKLTARNNEHTIWASTFQQLPKCAQEEKKVAKTNSFAMESKKLDLPVPGPRNSKHASKVSSLIKTFDKTADQGSGGSLIAVKQPIKNSFQKCKLNHGNDMACWDDTDILSNHKELSEYSEATQGSHSLSSKHEPQKRPNKIDLSYCGSDDYYPVLIEMSKVAKSNFSHSSKKALKNRTVKVNEPAKKGNFLHSENSAFESWNVHHKKLAEKEEFVGIKMKKEVHVPTGGFTYVPGEHISPQLGNTCPPWRRQRAAKGAAERRQTSKEKFTASNETCSLSEKVTGAKPGLEVTPLPRQVNSPGSISPPFNITELLTPIIPPKQEVDTVESELIPLTPPPTENTALRDHEGNALDNYRSRDSYKSKASSLLFNLKDVRKRVKSIYTPSPLLRALEEKNKMRENIQESTKINASLSTSQEKSNKNIADKDESSDITSILSGSIHEKDNKTDLTGHFTDNYLTMSSPQTTGDLLFYQTGDNLQQDNSTREDLVKNTRENENFPLFRHESKEPDLRKHLHYAALKPFSRDNADTTAGQNPGVQGEENERQATIQNENLAFKTVPNQLSPAEDVPYSDTQTDVVVPDREAQGRRSTSSSEQSFVSTVEQPLQDETFPPAPLIEEDELQYYACISSGTDAAEKKKGKVTGNGHGSLMKGKLRREKSKEANSMDSAASSVRDMSTHKPEEPQTLPTSSATKPSLFMIKDNTFRSPQVIRAVKLPLFRSFSLDDTVSSSYKEMEGRLMPPAWHNKQHQKMLHTQEVGWSASRHRGKQNVRDGVTDRGKEASEPGSTPATVDPSHLEDTENFSLGKHSLTHTNLGLENDQEQNNPNYPTEKKTNYFKNHHLSNRRGGYCAKKIITRETISPMTDSISEDHSYSPVSHEALEDILHTEGAPVLLDGLACSAVASPRSGSTMHSLTASSLSDKPTISGLKEIEDAINPVLLNMAEHAELKSQADMTAGEILDSTQRNLLSDSAGEADRLEPRDPRERTAGKPPAVPPKTEKALRRAKKLANRRKKMQEQQKTHQTEHTDAVGRKSSHSGQTPASLSALGYSPLHPAPHSTFTPTETSTGRPSHASEVSPSPSLTQRKVLQDPDSGQYYVVDLPAEVNVKTFYDPETGKYVQVSVPSSEGNLDQPSPSEIMNSPHVSYPRVLPLPASSVAMLKSPSQLSEPTWLMPAAPGEPPALHEGGQQVCRYSEAVDTQPCVEPASYSYSQNSQETKVHLGKEMSPTPNTDIVSITDLDDFAAEGVS